MSKEKNTGGPVNPCFERSGGYIGTDWTKYNKGITLRDYFASQALIGLLSSCSHPDSTGSNLENYTESPKHAYEIADAMLEERSRQ